MRAISLYVLLTIAIPFFAGAQVLNSIATSTSFLAQHTEPEKKSSASRVHKQVLIDGGVKVVLENFDFDFNFYILDFDVSIVDNGGYTMTESWKKSGTKPAKNFAAFNDSQKRLLFKVRRGDKVTIENIRVRGDDGVERTLNPIRVKII